MSIDLDLLGGAYLLRALGFMGAGFEGDLEQLAANPQLLSQLQDHFGVAAGDMGHSQSLAWALQNGGIAPSMFMPPPNQANCPCPQHYAMGQMPFGFGMGMTSRMDLKELFGNRRQAKKFERLLKRNPFLRAQVEMMLGGQIIEDKKNDGKIKVRPFMTGGFSGGMDPNTMMALGALAQLQQAAMGAGVMTNANQQQLFQGLMLAALANMYAGPNALGAGGPNNPGGGNRAAGGGGLPRRPGGGSPFVDWADQPHRPGRNGPHQGRFGIGQGGDEVTSVLNDPSLTVEDKVTLMIMLIMKKMDKDIEKQAHYINSLQQQQNGGQGGFPGGGGGQAGGGGGEGSSPSIDVETMKLKRLIDKRSQMFDMLRQIIDKYNQTAKGIIDSMGR
jgi:hypothetical protein